MARGALSSPASLLSLSQCPTPARLPVSVRVHCIPGHGSSGLWVSVHTPTSSSAFHCQHPPRGHHKVSISEAHFCAMDIEPGRKESRLLSVMDGFSRGLPRVVLKGTRTEPRGPHSFQTCACLGARLCWGSVCSTAGFSRPPPLPPNTPTSSLPECKTPLSPPFRIKAPCPCVHSIMEVAAPDGEVWLGDRSS